MEHERSKRPAGEDRARTRTDGERPVRKRPEPERAARTRTEAERPAAREQAGEKRTQPAQSKQKKPRMRRMNRSALRIRLLTVLGIVAAIVLSLLIFFKVNRIEVIDHKQPEETTEENADGLTAEGAHVFYTRDEIVAASGIEIGDNLLALNKAQVAANVKQALPYVNEVQIKRSLPNTVVITVTEYEISYSIRDEAGVWWLISSDGRVLEQTTAQIAENEHIHVDGMQICAPQPGETIEPVGADGADPTELSAKKSAVLLVLGALEDEPEIAKQIVSLDVSSSYNVEMWYGTQYRVLLGKAEEELTYKFACLTAILNSFEQEKRSYLSGTIDLTFFEGRSARFLPTE